MRPLPYVAVLGAQIEHFPLRNSITLLCSKCCSAELPSGGGIYTTSGIHEQSMNHISPKKAGLYMETLYTKGHSLHRTHFSQCQASSAVLG